MTASGSLQLGKAVQAQAAAECVGGSVSDARHAEVARMVIDAWPEVAH